MRPAPLCKIEHARHDDIDDESVVLTGGLHQRRRPSTRLFHAAPLLLPARAPFAAPLATDEKCARDNDRRAAVLGGASQMVSSIRMKCATVHNFKLACFRLVQSRSARRYAAA